MEKIFVTYVNEKNSKFTNSSLSKQLRLFENKTTKKQTLPPDSINFHIFHQSALGLPRKTCTHEHGNAPIIKIRLRWIAIAKSNPYHRMFVSSLCFIIKMYKY